MTKYKKYISITGEWDILEEGMSYFEAADELIHVTDDDKPNKYAIANDKWNGKGMFITWKRKKTFDGGVFLMHSENVTLPHVPSYIDFNSRNEFMLLRKK